MPSARQASRFTRGSDSALLQRSNCRRAMLSEVNPERTCRRAPTTGADDPALARQTISSPCGKARAAPVAPVMYCARSTSNCSAESSSVSSRVPLPREESLLVSSPLVSSPPTEETRALERCPDHYLDRRLDRRVARSGAWNCSLGHPGSQSSAIKSGQRLTPKG
jgi:hypothetical protein